MAPRTGLSRRALLGALGAGAVAGVVGCSTLDPDEAAPVPEGVLRVRYGDEHPAQHGDLRRPDGDPVGLAVLVHGGFWSASYGKDLMEPMADDLGDRGWVTWNVEYRRVGDGGGYPATFADIAAAFDEIPDLGLAPGLPVVSLGHSAGGHLAVWSASRTARTPGGAPRFVPGTTISLSGVLDLTSAAAQGLGGSDTRAVLGAGSDPSELVPAQGKVLAVHADDDEVVPLDQSSTYVRLAGAAGGDARLVGVPGGHFDLIDPSSAAWAAVLELL